MDTRRVAAATNIRVHPSVISVTLPPKHCVNFVLSCTPVNKLEHPCQYVVSETALNPTVSSTNLLTVLIRQCVPLLCDHPGNTRVQRNTALQSASTAYETGFFASFTALALSTYNVGTHYVFHQVLQADISANGALSLPYLLRQILLLLLRVSSTIAIGLTMQFHCLHTQPPNRPLSLLSDVTCKAGIAEHF